MNPKLQDHTDEIMYLIAGAADALRQRDPEAAAWRIADAGGLLRDMLGDQPDSIIGLTEPTGRGAKLPHLYGADEADMPCEHDPAWTADGNQQVCQRCHAVVYP